jgi:hypothetical protein
MALEEAFSCARELDDEVKIAHLENYSMDLEGCIVWYGVTGRSICPHPSNKISVDEDSAWDPGYLYNKREYTIIPIFYYRRSSG